MAGEWKAVPLTDLYEIGSGLSKPRSEFGFGQGFLTFKDVLDNYFVPDQLSALVNSTNKEQANCSVMRGDVFLTRTSETQPELGMSSVALKDYPKATFNGFTKRLRPKTPDVVVPEYAAYYFRGPRFRQSVTSMSSLSTRASLNNEMIARLSIVLPPVPQQKAIGIVLKALDDKIELNRRRSRTLEAMVRAIFQSWFVDFDPVKTKAAGRTPPGLSPALAALFPDSFTDSPLGPIPKGWGATTLGEVCQNGGGSVQTGPFGAQLHASDYVAEGIPSIMPSNIRDNRLSEDSIARIKVSDAERLSNYRVRTGDVVYSRRGDVELRSLIREHEDGWLCGTGCMRVRFGPLGLKPLYGASILGTPEARAWVVRHAVGATMPNLNTAILSALPLVVAPPPLQSIYSDIVGNWDESGSLSLRQSRTLVALRDALLPKLISGELRVPDAERIVGRAV